MAAAATILDVIQHADFIAQVNVIEQAIAGDLKSGILETMTMESASQDAINAANEELTVANERTLTQDTRVSAAKKAVAHASNALNLWVSKASELEHIPDELAKKLNAMRGIQTYLLHLIEHYDIPLTIESPSAVAARTTVAEESTEEGAAPESPSLPRRPTLPGLAAGRRFSMATGTVAPEVSAALADVRGERSDAAGGAGASATSAPTVVAVPGTHYFAIYAKALLPYLNKVTDLFFKKILYSEIAHAIAYTQGSISPPKDISGYILSRLQAFTHYDLPPGFDITLIKLGRKKDRTTNEFILNPEIFISGKNLKQIADTILVNFGFDSFELNADEQTIFQRTTTKFQRTRRASMSDTPVCDVFEIPRKAKGGVEVAPALLSKGTPRPLTPRAVVLPATAEAPFLGAATMAASGGGSSTPAPAPAPSRAE